MLALLNAIAARDFDVPIPRCGLWMRIAEARGFITRVRDGACAFWILTEDGRDFRARLIDARTQGEV